MTTKLTTRQQAVIAWIQKHGPITTRGLIREGLDPRAANNLLADDRLQIGERGYELATRPVPTECGCGCGGFPNAKHEREALERFWEHWWETPSAWIRAQMWCVRWPLPVIGALRLTPSQVPEGEACGREPAKPAAKKKRRSPLGKRSAEHASPAAGARGTRRVAAGRQSTRK